MKPELSITDQRTLELIDNLKASGIVKSKKEFCQIINESKIAVLYEQHIPQIAQGKQRFTLAHIEAICTIFNVNANYLMGLEDKMYRPITIRRK